MEELYVEVLYTVLHMIGCDTGEVRTNKKHDFTILPSRIGVVSEYGELFKCLVPGKL